MLVLARLEERRLRGAGAGEDACDVPATLRLHPPARGPAPAAAWEDACDAVDEWIDREGMLEGLTDPGAANRWKAVGPAGEGEP